MKYWLLIDIGCLECGKETEPRGLFATREAALETLTLRERATFDEEAQWLDADDRPTQFIGGRRQIRVFEVEVRA